MLSFMGMGGRILHGPVDGENLIIRSTQLYSCQTEDEIPLDLHVRFLMSEPTGITTAITSTLQTFTIQYDEIDLNGKLGNIHGRY